MSQVKVGNLYINRTKKRIFRIIALEGKMNPRCQIEWVKNDDSGFRAGDTLTIQCSALQEYGWTLYHSRKLPKWF